MQKQNKKMMFWKVYEFLIDISQKYYQKVIDFNIFLLKHQEPQKVIAKINYFKCNNYSFDFSKIKIS